MGRIEAYTVRVNDLSLYTRVRDYLTNFRSLYHYKSERMVDPRTKKQYINIYVDYIAPIKLRPERLYGVDVKECSRIPKQEIKSIFKGRYIIDPVIIDEQSDNEEMSEPDDEELSESKSEQAPKLDYIKDRMESLEAKLNTALDMLQQILKCI